MQRLQLSAIEADVQNLLAATHNVLYCLGLDFETVNSDKHQKGQHAFNVRFREGWVGKLRSMKPGSTTTFSSYWPR